MKIINLIENLDDAYGGPAKSVPYLCKYLNDIEVDTEILSIKYHENEINSVVDKYKLKWKSFNYNFIKKIRYSLGLKEYLDKQFKDNSSAILHTHNQWNYIPYISLIIKKKYNCLLVATIRGSIDLDKVQKKIAWYLFQKKMLNNCNILHVTKKSDIIDLRKMGIRSKIAYVPNGINLEEFKNMPSPRISKENLELEKDKKYILFLGRIHHTKGLDYLVNSWINVSSKYKEWDLLIVGPVYDEQYKNRIVSKIVSHGLVNRVHFKGMLSGNKKIESLGASSLFVLPSYSENFGMSISEAMASKIPVITTQGTPWQELEEHNAGWWVELNQDNIDKALESALSLNDSELKQKGLNGFELIQKYEWKYQAKKMKEFYEWILNDRVKPEFVYEVEDKI